MITEQDLKAAIAECEGARSPNANTCIKLASYYTILDKLKSGAEGEPTPSISRSEAMYSYSPGYLPYSNSEFSQVTEQKSIDQVFPIIDELMDALMVLNPKLYKSVIRKIEDL